CGRARGRSPPSVWASGSFWRGSHCCASSPAAPARCRPGSLSPAPWPRSTASFPTAAGPRRPEAEATAVMSTRVCDVQSRRLMLTHLDQVWWPEAEITKEELLEYYTRVADYVLPFTANRALRLQRIDD